MQRSIFNVFILILCLTSALLSGCGRRGKLRPPETPVPKAVQDLKLEQQGDQVILSFSEPTRKSTADPSANPVGVRISRRLVLPPQEDCEECTGAYRLLREFEFDYLADVRRVGNRLILEDMDLERGKTYQYKVVVFTVDGTESAPSNLARRTVIPPPAPPAGFHLTPSPTGIVLQWDPAVLPQGMALVGYRIYRQSGTDEYLSLPGPPVTEPTFEDLRLERGKVYRYQVRTIGTMAGETATSLATPTQEGKLAEPE